MSSVDDRLLFYEILEELESRVGYQRLVDCDGRMGWPQRGVYFFYEEGEVRRGGDSLRVVRIGTHAVSKGSKTTLWNRLSNHRGPKSTGGGNHRGSVFRLLVGRSLINRGDIEAPIPDRWGSQSHAPRDILNQEVAVEQKVSEHIGHMPFLWIRVDDEARKDSARAYIEKNAIRLLSCISDSGQTGDRPSENWLGRHSHQLQVRESGLWNVRMTEGAYDREFLSVLESLAAQTPALSG